MKLVGAIAFLLVVIGALNLGLVGLLGTDVIASVFGGVTNIVNILIGLSGLYAAVTMLPKQFAR